MNLETRLKTKVFLDEISLSVSNIILDCFPQITREEKEDIDHEVKLKLWRGAARGKKIANLRSYLWRVVYTTALDVMGERMIYIPVDELIERAESDGISSPALLSPESSIESQENNLAIKSVVDGLPERRRLVVLHHLEGKDIPQIAALLSWRENQVRHLLYRGLAELREKLKPRFSKHRI